MNEIRARNRIIAAGILSIMASGCGTDVSRDSENRRFYCTDSRDGEMFSFYGTTVRNAKTRLLWADTCFDVTDDDGVDRTLCASYEAFMKCESIPLAIPEDSR